MKRAADNHPIMLKLKHIFEEMNKEGLSITWYDTCFVVQDISGEEWELRDLKHNTIKESQGPYEIPPFFEYKLIRC
jgi:hypothetical protein